MDLSKLKANSSLEKLTEKVEKLNQTQSYNDEDYWQPTVDKGGNGSAVIRFLPTPPQDLEKDEDALPFVKYYDHNFQGPGGWYIERCLTTLGKPDPCAEYNNKLWNTNIEANQTIARKQKRNTRYVSNIQIISDPAHPELDGEVKKFRFGPKIMEKCEAARKGDEDTAGFNPWDFWEGANFRIKIKTTTDKKTGAKFRSYDDSKFAPQTPLSKNEDELEAIWKKEFSLIDELAPSKFKSYDELKEKLNKVLALNDATPSVAKTTKVEVTPPVAPSVAEDVTPPWEEPGESDSTLSMFEKLAQDV